MATTVYQYDANNNRTNVVENGKTNSWTFDAYNRVSSYLDTEGNLIQYRYDANGNLTNLIYPGDRTVAYSYDSLNRLTNVMDWANRQTAFTYDLASRLRSVTRPNGTVRLINYDAAGQATNIVEKTASNYPIAFFRLNYNAAARVQWEFAGPLPHSNSIPSRTMTYDDDNRLATFEGDNVGNDSDGNLTTFPMSHDYGAYTFAVAIYDARNRLTYAYGVSNVYDAADNRIRQIVGADTVNDVVNPNAALSQVLMRVKNGVTNYYVYGLGLLYEVTETATNTSTATYHYDFRGSTIALTDGNGIPTDRVEYSLYGLTTYRSGTNDTPFLFNGRYGVMTDANGLLYMRARYYNPQICRFLNADPSGFSGGLNFYAYADGNPVSFIDPFGLYGNPVSGPNGPVGPSSPYAPGGAFYVPHTPVNYTTPTYEGASTAAGIAGVAQFGAEYGSGTAAVGSNFRFYSGGFYGNQYVSVTTISQGARYVGYPLAAASVILDLKNPSVSKEQFAINTGVTGIGLFGGRFGASFALGYGAGSLIEGPVNSEVEQTFQVFTDLYYGVDERIRQKYR